VRGNANLVAFGVSEVRAIVICVVLGPQAGSALAENAKPQRRLVCRSHGSSAARSECDHLTVSGEVRLAVEWLGDDEVGPLAAVAMPAGPGLGWFMEAELQTQLAKDRAVESEGPFEVCDAGEDVREHLGGISYDFGVGK